MAKQHDLLSCMIEFHLMLYWFEKKRHGSSGYSVGKTSEVYTGEKMIVKKEQGMKPYCKVSRARHETR